MQCKITQQALKKLAKKDYLLTQEDIVSPQNIREGEVIDIYHQTKFLGKAIVGRQNKGIGYIFTQNQFENFDTQLFDKLFKNAQNYRKTIKHKINSNAYRLFNGESDGLCGVTIDLYDDVAVFSWYNKGIYYYAQDILKSFISIYPEIFSVYEKIRFSDNDILFESRLIYGEPKDYVEIIENDVKFATYMNEGLMTGIFLDQREVRNYIKAQSKNKMILNTFSYTGAFSVVGACGGASATTSVDVANRSLDKTKQHFILNDINLANQKIYVMDVFDYFKYAIKKNLIYDWVILDPPSFARTKKRTFSVLKNYKELLCDAILLTATNGRIVVSTNASNFKKESVEEMIRKTFERMNRKYVIEKTFQLPDDFKVIDTVPYTNYLKVYVVKLLN